MSTPRLITGGNQKDPSFQSPLLDTLLTAINNTQASSEISIAVSFIRASGWKLLHDALYEALARGVKLQVITSDYLNVTEPVALREMMLLEERGAQLQIYESQGNTGFHLKSYLIIQQHDSQWLIGLGLVGSSNISRAALTESLEWNWKVSVDDHISSPAAQSLLELKNHISVLSADRRLVPLTHEWIDAYIGRYELSEAPDFRLLPGDSMQKSLPEKAIPTLVQFEALEALRKSRQQGFKRGLVVMATGLGKTWLAAFDAKQMHSQRLLFVAHREEILLQAQATFIRMNPNAHTGLYNGQKQEQADWLFASIQTIGRADHLHQFTQDHFDYIVVDEFHHATAPSYRKLLDYFRPKFLLGLTATPDRTDQASILALCDDNLVFERGLRDAITDKHLAPFHYHGIYDEHINYEAIPWRNGRFDPNALENAFSSLSRAKHAYMKWRELAQTRTLAFCISVRHAIFMAEYFRKQGVKAQAVYAGSDTPRNKALSDLQAGKLDIIFSVDLFNEGTDIPSIDTLLMLRATESRIVFLQQLGRGLRNHPNKSHLVVIDLVGNHKACLFKPELLGSIFREKSTSKPGQGDIQLPDNCYINLEPQVIDLMTTLRYGQRIRILDDYRNLKDELGYRPTAAQAFQANFDFTKLRQQHGSWFKLVQEENDLTLSEQRVYEQLNEFLHKGIETTSLSKSFKIVLLQALLELDGLRNPPTLEQLAAQSRYVLERHPDLLELDLPEAQKELVGQSKAWTSYWKKNPIKHSTTGSKDSKTQYWFTQDNNRYQPRFDLPNTELETLHQMIQELLDYRFAEYRRRKSN